MPAPPRVLRLRDHPRLVLLSAGLAALEALVIVTVGPGSAVSLAPQVVAPAPFGVFHDLRWLLVFHPSWPAFVGELLLLVAWRTALDTVLTRAAWPAGPTAPPWREHLLRAARFTVVCAVALTLFAVLTFAMAVTSLSWLFFVAVPVLVMVALLVHHGSVDPSWCRNAPTRRSIVGVLLAFAALTVTGGILTEVPRWLAPPLAGIGGIAVAWCRLRIVDAVVHREPTTRRRAFAVVGLTGVLVLVLVGTALGFAVSIAVEAARSTTPEARADSTGPPVLIVKGFNSQWEGVTRRWVSGNYRIRRFSYLGLDAAGEPRPYDRSDTHQSVRSLARSMRDQVEALARGSGQQVSIVAESEGALIAQTYLEGTPDAPVRAAVLLSPLLQPGRVAYPARGQAGWGVAAGVVMDGIAGILSALGPVDVSADTPLFRSIVEEAPAMHALLRCPVPGVREVAVLPLDSGVSAPPPLGLGMPYTVVPAFHGGLLGDHTTAELIGHVLRGESAESSPFWRSAAGVVQAGAAAWQVPSLEPALVPGWDRRSGGTCRTVRGELARWLGE